MARRDEAELEVLPVDAEAEAMSGSSPPRQWSRRRWLLVLGAAGASVAVVAGPVRSVLDRRAIDRTAGAYAAYRGYEAERQERSAPLLTALVPDDQSQVDAAIAALDREEARRLEAMAGGLQIPIVLDPTSWTMARSMRTALRARVADLEALARWRSAPVAVRGAEPADASAGATRAVDNAASLLGRQLAVIGGRMPSDQPRPLHAADAATAALRGWTDKPTETTLAASDGRSLIKVEIDKASVTSADFLIREGFQPTGPGSLIGRSGWVAALVGSHVASFPVGGVPHLLPIDRVNDAFAADRPDAIWVVTDHAQLVEVDERGDRISPTWDIPADTLVNPAVIADGFVISRTDGGALEAWTPSDGHRRMITAGGALLLAAQGETVVWQPAHDDAQARAPVHISDLRTGTDAVVPSPLDTQMFENRVGTTCSFSPDGRLLACSDLTHGQAGFPGDVYQLGIIDITAHTATVVPGASSDAPLGPMPLWTGDGRRVFFLTYTHGAPYVATWARGDAAATELRYHPVGWIGLAVVSSP